MALYLPNGSLGDTYIVHCLHADATFCGMGSQPDRWPEEHWWLSLEDWPVNDQRLLVAKVGGHLCPQCDEAAQAYRVLREHMPGFSERIQASHRRMVDYFAEAARERDDLVQTLGLEDWK